MTAKSLIHYFEVNCRAGKFRGTIIPGENYEIEAPKIDDPGIEEWMKKRFTALTKLEYILSLYTNTTRSVYLKDLAYGLEKNYLNIIDIRLSVNKDKYFSRISCFGGRIEFSLLDFEHYHETITIKLEALRKFMQEKIDEAMVKLGEACEKQEKTEAKIKEFGIEENNDYD